jgi:hypothetical protein
MMTKMTMVNAKHHHHRHQQLQRHQHLQRHLRQLKFQRKKAVEKYSSNHLVTKTMKLVRKSLKNQQTNTKTRVKINTKNQRNQKNTTPTIMTSMMTMNLIVMRITVIVHLIQMMTWKM